MLAKVIRKALEKGGDFADVYLENRISRQIIMEESVFKSGLYATLIFKNLAYGWETFVETKTGLVELKSRVPETDPIKIYTDIVEMFRTRVEPRSHESILTEIAILEALERSATSEKWEEVMPV